MSKKEDTKVQTPEEVKEQNTPEVETPETSNEEVKKEEKALTQEEVNKIVQERLAKEEKKFEKRLIEERQEAERIATLSQEEKQKELEAKKQKEFESKQKELAVRENTLTAREKLRDADISEDMAKFFVTPNLEETEEKIEEFIKARNEDVYKAVQDRLKGSPPKDISSSSNERKDRKVVTAF